VAGSIDTFEDGVDAMQRQVLQELRGRSFGEHCLFIRDGHHARDLRLSEYGKGIGDSSGRGSAVVPGHDNGVERDRTAAFAVVRQDDGRVT
jgi:hypothetical protein